MSDKRAVTTDALETLGTFITEKEKRDAIHLAVEPSTAGQLLSPGDHVILKDGKAFKAKVGKGIGIVDPFLLEEVETEQMFWLVVYPRRITSLRHVWEHPDFPTTAEVEMVKEIEKIDSDAAAQAKRSIERIASDLGVDYDELMSHADDYSHGGDFWTKGEEFEGERLPDEFWIHYATVTGKPFHNYGNFLNCSC
jgi:hypothetical protein